MVALYAFGRHVLGFSQAGLSQLALLALAIGVLALLARYVRLRREGVQLWFLRMPPLTGGERTKSLGMLVVAAGLGSYAVYEILDGNVALGTIGAVASASMTLVLVRGLSN